MGGKKNKKLKCAIALLLAFNLSACYTPAKRLGGYVHSVTTLIKEPIKKRALVSRESEILNRFFGNTIDTSQVQIWLYEDTHETIIADTRKNVIRIFGRDNYSSNYSLEENPDLYGAFIFNATLIAQYQADSLWPYNKRSNQLSYRLDTSHKTSYSFNDFGKYQQAAIMEDYARRFTHPSHKMKHIRKTTTVDNCEAQKELLEIVETAFPHARALRMTLSSANMRDLTEDEKAFLDVFFQGEYVSWDTVTITGQPMYCYDRTASAIGKANITFWGPDNHSDDYSKESNNPVLFRLFFHEATHLWQAQNNYRYTDWRHVNPAGKYVYELNLERWSFDDYEVEQQGRIIEDYVGLFLHPDQEAGTPVLSETEKQQLQILVENRFPGARSLRLRLNQQQAKHSGSNPPSLS